MRRLWIIWIYVVCESLFLPPVAVKGLREFYLPYSLVLKATFTVTAIAGLFNLDSKYVLRVRLYITRTDTWFWGDVAATLPSCTNVTLARRQNLWAEVYCVNMYHCYPFIMHETVLTYLCLALHKLNIGKQCRPRSDATFCGV